MEYRNAGCVRDRLRTRSPKGDTSGARESKAGWASKRGQENILAVFRSETMVRRGYTEAGENRVLRGEVCESLSASMGASSRIMWMEGCERPQESGRMGGRGQENILAVFGDERGESRYAEAGGSSIEGRCLPTLSTSKGPSSGIMWMKGRALARNRREAARS
jgi:hypothetical protein